MSPPVYGPNTCPGHTIVFEGADARTAVFKGFGYSACCEHLEGCGALATAVAEADVLGEVRLSISSHVKVTGGSCVGGTKIIPIEEIEIDSPGE